MANTSIYKAFARIWQHVLVALAKKSDLDHAHNTSEFNNDAGYLTEHQSLAEYAKTVDLGALALKDIVAKADLAAGVQTSLNLADTALQSFIETDPTVPTWAKADSKPVYTALEVGAAEANHIHDTDITLTQQGVAADAKAVGDVIATMNYINATDDGTGIITLSVSALTPAEGAEF